MTSAEIPGTEFLNLALFLSVSTVAFLVDHQFAKKPDQRQFAAEIFSCSATGDTFRMFKLIPRGGSIQLTVELVGFTSGGTRPITIGVAIRGHGSFRAVFNVCGCVWMFQSMVIVVV